MRTIDRECSFLYKHLNFNLFDKKIIIFLSIPSKHSFLAQAIRRVTDIKIFDNSTQSADEFCYNKPCPGLMLPTPRGCVCVCGNEYDLNASGTQCLRQAKTVVKNECAPGIMPNSTLNW